jgi:hypothetical protein
MLEKMPVKVLDMERQGTDIQNTAIAHPDPRLFPSLFPESNQLHAILLLGQSLTEARKERQENKFSLSDLSDLGVEKTT